MAKAKKEGTKKLSSKVQRGATHVKSTDEGEDRRDRVTLERRDANDRRKPEDRRKESTPVVMERRAIERRTKVSRRRQIDPTTCERDYTPEEIEFMGALDDYKRTSGRMFPTCSEILEVIKKLGYQKNTDESNGSATDPLSAGIQQTAV